MPSSSGAEESTTRRAAWWGLGLRGLILSAALVFLVRGVHWHDMSGAIGRSGFLLPAVVVAMNACMMSLRALRLRILLQGNISFSSSFVTLLTSSAINNITPFRGGNVARLWMLERAAGVTKSAAIALTVVENLLEVLVLAAVGFAASWFVAGQRWAAVATPVVFSAAIAVLVLLRVTAGRAADSATAARPGLGCPGWIRESPPAARAARTWRSCAVEARCPCTGVAAVASGVDLRGDHDPHLRAVDGAASFFCAGHGRIARNQPGARVAVDPGRGRAVRGRGGRGPHAGWRRQRPCRRLRAFLSRDSGHSGDVGRSDRRAIDEAPASAPSGPTLRGS